MSFYSNTAPVPSGIQTAMFLLRPLRAADNPLDYAAVMASQDLLRIGTLGAWPRDGFTREENLHDLQAHQADHRARHSFTFTVMNLAETECLGCVYINPVDTLRGRMLRVPPPLAMLPGHSASVEFWMRPTCVQANIDRALLQTLRTWFAEAWAFAQVVYPATHREQRQLHILQRAGLQLLATTQTRYSTLYVYT
jgi:hypothetical protein